MARQLEMQGLELGPHFRPSSVLWKLQPKWPANPNKRGPHHRDQSALFRSGSSWKRYLRPARGTVAGSLRTPRQEGRTWGETPQARCAESQPCLPSRAPTHPPLLVLLPIHDDHVALRERQLVRVVGHAVVQRFDPLRLQPGLREERRGQRLAWPGGAAHGQRTGPRGPDHRSRWGAGSGRGQKRKGRYRSLGGLGTRWLEPGVLETSFLALWREGQAHLLEALVSCPARWVLGAGRGHPAP